jgi:hypothetical protein
MSALPAQITSTEADTSIPISYSDIYVWISNKGLNQVMLLVKSIWDATAADALEKKSLDDFARVYCRFMVDRFKKYKRKLRTAQHLVHAT